MSIEEAKNRLANPSGSTTAELIKAVRILAASGLKGK